MKDICKGTRNGEHEEGIAKVVKELKLTKTCSVRSLPCPTDSFWNLVIPADSGGIHRNEI